jgi:hypothetical protein
VQCVNSGTPKTKWYSYDGSGSRVRKLTVICEFQGKVLAPHIFFNLLAQPLENIVATPVSPHILKMVSLQSNKDKRVSRPTYRKVLSIREKEAAAKKKEKAGQQEARKKLQAAKKAQAQLPAVELVDDNDDDNDNGDDGLPAVVPALPPASTLQKPARVTKPAKPARVELSYQLGAFVIEKEVYVNAGMITMASFDYNSLCLKADDAARKFTRQNSLELGERSSIAFLRSGKQTRFSKPLENLEDWQELDKLALLLLSDNIVRAPCLDWELR